MEGIVQSPMMFAVPMPMCYYWPPQHMPQEAAYPPEVTQPHCKQSPEEEVCEARRGEVNHAEDEIYYQLVDSYEHPNLWRFVEEGLWVRATTLPMVEACYVEKTGDHCRWGSSTEDFERALDRFSYGFVHFQLTDMEARVISADQAWNTLHGLRVAMRHLRAHPKLIGFASIDDGRRAFLEAAWNDDKKRPTKSHLEDDLVMAIVRDRKMPVTFW